MIMIVEKARERERIKSDYCFHASITTYTSNSCTKFRKINLVFLRFASW